MGKTEVQIREDLQRQFPEIFVNPVHQKYLPDYAAIGSFLSDLERVEPPLSDLETALAEVMFTKLGYNSSAAGKLLKGARRDYYVKQARGQFGGWQSRLEARNASRPVKKDLAFSKLLSDELSRVETLHGFRLHQDENGHPKAQMIMPLKAEEFRAQLRDRRPFKDPTIGADHGEFTHRVQWYLIATAQVVTKPGEAYSKIGEVPWSVSGNFGLWDALCDRQPEGAPGLPDLFPFYKEGIHDFRTPEALLTWLCQELQQRTYPLLAGFLKARKEKRAFVTEMDSFKDPLVLRYLSRKIFDRPYEALPQQQQEYVAGFLEAGQQQGVLLPNAQGPGYKPK